MKILKSIFSLSKFEVFLLTFSIFVVTVSSILAKSNALNTTASIIGVTALIYIAKGLPLGQILSIIFCILYALCSYTFKYYGELATYLFMSLPASIISLVVWLKNPFQEDKTEIKIEKLSKYKIVISIILSLTITILFYYILKALLTPNLIISTISVFTSMIACCFLILRSPFYALFYSINDLVLITLWILATLENIIYLNLVFCFIIFLINDLYAFYNWLKLNSKQEKSYNID